MKRFCLVLTIFLYGNVFAMKRQPPLGVGQWIGQEIIVPLQMQESLNQLAHALQALQKRLTPQSVYGHFNLEQYQRAPRDVQNLIAQQIIGKRGWWYPAINIRHQVLVRRQLFLAVGGAQMFYIAGDYIVRITNTKIKVWDDLGEKIVDMPNEFDTTVISFDPDQQLFYAEHGKNTIIVFDREGQQKFRKQVDYPIDEIDHKHDKLLIADQKGRVTLYKLDGTEITTFKTGSQLQKIFFTKRGDMILAVSKNSTISVWDVQGHQLMQATHPNVAFADMFEQEKHYYIYSVSRDGLLKSWDFNGKELARVELNKILNHVEFSETPEKTLLYFEDNTLEQWKFDKEIIEKLSTISVDQEMEFFYTNPIGDLIITKTTDSSYVTLWNDHGDQIRTFSGEFAGFMGDERVVTHKFPPGETTTIWEQYKRYTLPQVLLREILHQYMQVTRLPQEVDVDKLLPDLAKRLNLKLNELKEIWQTFPKELKESIVKTLKKRGVSEQEPEQIMYWPTGDWPLWGWGR